MDGTNAHARTRAPRRGRRRGIALLVSMLIGTLLVVVPASPASAIQTIAWTTPPPSSAALGQTVSFSWTGRADTFLGARITGCFVNFPDAPNYSNSFGGNFTTGNCNYQNRVVTMSPTYTIQVGFYLSSGGTMTMSWNISVAAPSPTLVNLPANNTLNLTADTPNGGTIPQWNVYGQDQSYGTYSASCSPIAGTVLNAGTYTGSCSATNAGGKTTTQAITINIDKGTPAISWGPASQYIYGATWDQVMSASTTTFGLEGSWSYTENGVAVSATTAIPAGSHTLVGTWTPTSTTANNWRSVATSRQFTVIQTAQTVQFSAAPVNKTYGNAPFLVNATGTSGGGQVSIAAQAGSPCTVSSPSGTTSVTATITLTGAGSCVLLANQAASGSYTAAPQVSWGIAIGKATSTVSWPAPGAITYGTTLASVLNATASVPGTITYKIGTTPVSASTVLNAGLYTVVATFTPQNTTNYTTASASISQRVNLADPRVTIDPVADTTYGAAMPQLRVTTPSPSPRFYETNTATVCAVDGSGLVTLVGSGTCSIWVHVNQQGNYLGGGDTISFEVAKAQPGLTWSSPSDITYGTALDGSQLNAQLDTSAFPYGTPAMGATTYTYGSGLPADGAVLDAGDHELTATWTPFAEFAGRYLPVTKTVTIHIEKAFANLSFATPTDITYGTPLGDDQLAATVDGVTGTFAYTVDGGDDPAAGQVLDAGPHTIVATFVPDVVFASNYLATSTAVTLVVNQAGQEISVDPIAHRTFGDAPFTVSATGGGSGNPVVITADAGSSCTVEGSTVTLTGAGYCLLLASQAGNGNYLPAPQVTMGVTIGMATPQLTWAEPAGITYGQPLTAAQLNAKLAPAGATGQVHYYLADGVTPADGVVLHAGDDQTLVAIYVPDAQAENKYLPAIASVTIDVAKAPQVIHLGFLAPKTYGDGDFAVTAQGGGSGLPVLFSATGDACSVNANVVHINSAGLCTISADQPGNADYEAAETVSNPQLVRRATQTLGLAAIGGKTYGDAPFEVDLTPGASTTPAYVQVAGDCSIQGLTVTITGAGGCEVNASQGADLNYEAAQPVTRTFDISKARQDINFAELGTAGFADGSVPALASGGASGNPVTFTATGAACEVAGATVLIQHAGTCDVTAHQAGDRNYAAAGSVTRTLTVTPQHLSLAWSPAGLTYGDPVGAGQLNPTVTPAVPGTWSYSVNAGDVLDAGDHALHATFTPDATGDILPVAGDVTVVVDKANQTVTFGPIADHTFGDAPFGVTATGGASGNPVTFASQADGCSVAGTTVSITAAGGCTIAADQAGNGNFNAAPTVARSFGVTKAQPTIAWATPAAITYGTALGGDQLNATATFQGQPVAGTLTYGAEAGTVLHAGTTPQVLTVTFVPTNSRDFTGAIGSTTIVVNRAEQSISLPAIADHTYGDAPFGVPATGGASGQPVTIVATGDCTSAGSVVTITGAGGCTIAADQAGNGDFLAAARAVTSFAIAKAAGSVSIAPLGAHSYGDAPFTATALAGPSSGAISWAASGCSITSTGKVSITAAGTCQITATQAGDANHEVASKTVSFAVAKAAQVITFGALAEKTYGDAPFQVTATGSGSGVPVTFTAAGDACTAAGSSVTIVAAGTCTITANQAGSANYDAAAPVSQALTVKPATLTVTAQSANRAYGQANPTFTYAVTGFVNGDTAAAVTTAPTCTTTATTTSAAGQYPITCSGAASAKYTFSYVAGSLTVGQLPTRLTITSPSIQQAGTTTITATLTNALTGAPINGENVLLTADATAKVVKSSPATATYTLDSGLHVVGAVYFGSASYYPAIDAQLLVSYQKTSFVIWGGNTGGVKVGEDYTFYGSQWSKQVKQGTNGAGSSFKGYAASVNAAGTSWTATNSTQAPSSVGDVISVLVTTQTAKSGNNLSGNVTKQVLLAVKDADKFKGSGSDFQGELLSTL